MSRKLFTVSLILLLLICVQSAFVGSITLASAVPAPSQLKIFVGPTSVLADNRAYNLITVQLLDSKGAPARAQADMTISLSSSLTNIGSVDSLIVIPKGETSASANFRSTFTPGSTTITAAATGYMTVSASISTVAPVPSTLALYGFPPTLPADGNLYNAIVVQLQDSTGLPAKAPIGDIQVTLASSNLTVATVDSALTIKGGSTYAIANIKTSTSAYGSITITAISSGYASGQTTISTQPLAAQGTDLRVYLGPPKVPADGLVYQQVVVQLQNSSGNIAQSGYLPISLSSSSTDIGVIDQTITIPAFQSYALANFNTTYKSGVTTITATAPNCKTSQALLTTVGPIPSKLAVYACPSTLPADGRAYNAIKVQLQDSQGKPAKDPLGNVLVYLFSSTPDAGNVSSTLTIPFGETYATGTFFPTWTANSTTITAQGSGYTTAQTKITTYLIDTVSLNVSISADSDNIQAGHQATIRAHVAYNDSCPAKATISFTSSKGGSFTTPTDEGNGYYSTVFSSPNVSKQTLCMIIVNATKTGYNSTVENLQLTINSNTPSPSPSSNSTTTPTPKPTATATPKPTATVTPKPTATVSPSQSPTATPISTISPDASENSTITPSVSPSPSQKPGASTDSQTKPFPVAALIALGAVSAVVVCLAGYFFVRKRIQGAA
jgi:hypothetical protein